MHADDALTARRLRFITALLVLAAVGVSALALLLAAGWADPPIAPKRVLSASSPADLPLIDPSALSQDEGCTWAALPLADLTAPVTLQAEAVFSGDLAVWGFWFLRPGEPMPTRVVIHPAGSYSLSSAPAPDWTPFLHIRPTSNHLYLHIAADGRAELRINGELAVVFDAGVFVDWRGGIVFDSSSPPTWRLIQVNGS
ncbi:MAG: hypothetical protein L6Q98_09070 [Anaerolineae bacterium]|nr:hypothetical protein [Anaerolineae bacterium]NUQ03833.1 hypothetical protein [Anaerolineae bacterium]